MDAQTQGSPGRQGSQQSRYDGRVPGDFSPVATATMVVAELLCERIDLRPGQTVLDVATGSGNAALAAGRRGCEARGVDLLPALLDRARERARAERVHAGFQWGDAEAIPFPDDSFDVVLSVFGIMFTPDHARAADELLRVCRPGGTIGLANWAAASFVGAMLQGAARHAPLGRRRAEIVTWGSEEGIRGLFGTRVRKVEVSRRSFTFRYRSPESFLESCQTDVGLALSTFQSVDGPGQEALARTLRAVVHRFNRADDGTMIVPADYLEVVTSQW